MPPSARDFALYQLDRLSLPDWKRERIRRTVRAPEDPRDLALAERIVVTVVTNLLLLEHLAEQYSGRKRYQIDPLARKILAVALAQLRFLTRIPPSAAVDEAVGQAKRFGLGRAAGFVNAVLRRATREPNVPLPGEDDPQRHAELVLSHPPELFRRLRDQFGVGQALRICRHDNLEPPTLVRLFRGVTPGQLETPDVTLTPHEQPGILVVSGARRATFAEWAAKGLAQVQDATSAAIVPHLGVTPGQTVLDRCAGLGTKTMQIHDLLEGSGSVLAMDPAGERCEILRALIAQRRLSGIEVVQASFLRDLPALRDRRWDCVLVDAPCSNSGVLARRPEARYHQDARALASLRKLQLDILADTADRVVAGGLLVYSTCSIWREENDQLVRSFVESHPSFRIEQEQSWLPTLDDEPTRYRDGGYVCALRAAPG